MNNQLLNELDELIAAIEQPLTSDELVNGWSPEAQSATLGFLRSIQEAASQGREIPDVTHGGRALDHWGVLEGPLMEAACAFYNHLDERSR